MACQPNRIKGKANLAKFHEVDPVYPNKTLPTEC